MKSTIWIIAIVLSACTCSFQLYAQSRIWKQIDGLYGGNVRNVCFGANGQVYAVTQGGLYRSVDNCQSWSKVGPDGNKPNRITAAAVDPSGTIVVSVDGAIYYSADQCSTWHKSSGGGTMSALFTDSTGSFYGYSYGGGIIRSADGGKTWSSLALGTLAITGVQITRHGTWFAECTQGLWRSLDNGKSWTALGATTLDLDNICEYNDGTLFGHSSQGVLYRSNDNGATWSTVPWTGDNILMMFIDRYDRLMIGTFNSIYSSINKGATWLRTPMPSTVYWSVFMTQDASGIYYAGGNAYGLNYSIDGKTWLKSIAGMTASMPTLLCESHSGALFADAADVLYVSRDDGDTWVRADVPYAGATNGGVVDLHGHIFLVGSYGLMRSDDDGVSWKVGIGRTLYNINYLRCTTDGVLFASTAEGATYRSTDEGQNWSQVQATELPMSLVSLLLTKGGSVLTVKDGKIRRSTDKGTTWSDHGSIPGEYWSAVAEAPNGSLIASTGNGLFATTDEGVSWTKLCFNDMSWFFNSLTFDTSGSLFATNSQKIYMSTDNGASAVDISAGIVADGVRELTSTSKGYLFATTWSYGLYRTLEPVKPLSYPIKLPTLNPTEYTLTQNYPNPFNPTTSIAFGIPADGLVSLKIYNALGQFVAELESQPLAAGTYVRTWNATGFPSGVYFYRLQAGTYTETKRLVLLK